MLRVSGVFRVDLPVHFPVVFTTTGTAVWLLWLNRSRIVLVALLGRDGRWLVGLLVVRHRRLVFECNQLTASVLCSVSEMAAFVCAHVPVQPACSSSGCYVACACRPDDGSESFG